MKAISRTYSLLLLFPFAFDKASCPPPTATVRQKGGKHTLAHCGTVGRRSLKVYHLLLLLLLSILFSLCLKPGKCSLYTNDFRRNRILWQNLSWINFFLLFAKALSFSLTITTVAAAGGWGRGGEAVSPENWPEQGELQSLRHLLAVKREEWDIYLQTSVDKAFLQLLPSPMCRANGQIGPPPGLVGRVSLWKWFLLYMTYSIACLFERRKTWFGFPPTALSWFFCVPFTRRTHEGKERAREVQHMESKTFAEAHFPVDPFYIVLPKLVLFLLFFFCSVIPA